MKDLTKKNQIGTLSEKSLHASLKIWYSKHGDLFEVPFNGYVIDIIRGEELIEIQTGNFSSFRNKIKSLSTENKIKIIYPIADTKWIVKQELNGKQISRRKSPKKGKVEDVFGQLIYMPEEITHENISLLVLLVQVNEIWINDGKGSWRRKKWSKTDLELINITKQIEFNSLMDYQNLITASVPNQFTTLELSQNNNITRKQAQKMCYSLRKMKAISEVGKIGKAKLYEKIKL